MAKITGRVYDVGLDGARGTMWLSAGFRAGTGGVVAPRRVAWPITGGDLPDNVIVEPGPAFLEIDVGVSARLEKPVVIPDEDVTLADLVSTVYDWTPQEVAEFVRLRDEAVAAAQDAAASAQAAAGSESAAASSALAADGSAQAAAGHAQDAAGSASSAASSASAAASSASSAADDASAAAGSASDAASSASDADQSATAAASSASDAAGSEAAAAGHASAAGADADRAQQYADSFGLSTTTTTGAPGSPAQVTVTGDGPAYEIGFTVPQGEKGGPGPPGEVSQAALDAAVASLVDGAPEALDTLSELADALGNDPNFATTVSTEIGKRALIDGAPEAYNTLGKLVAALQNHELGGSTDASLLTGALTDQVDASAAMVTYDPGGEPATMPLSSMLFQLLMFPNQVDAALGTKADADHTHTPAEVGLGNVDNTSDADKPVSTAQQAALDGKEPASWTGTQAQYDALGSYDPDTTYWIV